MGAIGPDRSKTGQLCGNYNAGTITLGEEIIPIGSMDAIYICMVTFTITIPPMLAYIHHTWTYAALWIPLQSPGH